MINKARGNHHDLTFGQRKEFGFRSFNYNARVKSEMPRTLDKFGHTCANSGNLDDGQDFHCLLN